MNQTYKTTIYFISFTHHYQEAQHFPPFSSGIRKYWKHVNIHSNAKQQLFKQFITFKNVEGVARLWILWCYDIINNTHADYFCYYKNALFASLQNIKGSDWTRRQIITLDLYKNWGIITKFLIVMPFVMSVTDIINIACSMWYWIKYWEFIVRQRMQVLVQITNNKLHRKSLERSKMSQDRVHFF